MCVSVCVSACVYTHSPSQPITVPRSRQLSPPPSSLSPPFLFLLLLLLHPSSQLTGESQRGALARGPFSLGESLHHYGTRCHAHTCAEQHTTCLLCLFLSITVSLHPSIKPLAFALLGFFGGTHTHLILMFPLYLSLNAPQMGLSPLGSVYNRVHRTDTEFCCFWQNALET